MPVEQRLDLDDGNVLAAADDDVLAAAADADVAVGVHVGEIAGVEPALGVGVVPLRALEIAAEIRAGAHHQLADLRRAAALAPFGVDHLDLDAGQRTAVGGEGEPVVVVELDQRHRAVLGHAPGRDDLGAQACARLLDERPGNRRAGAEKGPSVGTPRPVSATTCVRSVRNGVEAMVKVAPLARGSAPRALAGSQMSCSTALAFEHDRHHQAVHEAGLVSHRRGHQYDVVAPSRSRSA